MAIRRARDILVSEMVPGIYTKRQVFVLWLRGRRCAIERLGIGWRLLSFPHLSPQRPPTRALLRITLPGRHAESSYPARLRPALGRSCKEGYPREGRAR